MSDEKFQRFGRYLILDHLVDGGMAKICRARHLGEQANKIVAVKMVQEKFSKDPAFVQMFEDELKVTFGLLHPNIAQVYDYGMVDHQLYAAMEYVDGANLKQFLDRLKQKNFVFPVEISTYIISQVCQALHYAHTFTDKLTGKPFRIIHRDISPHNIMLAYDGSVKVIDFGIAKADSNSEATQAGTIKGKLSYLAPEYLEGLDLDHRYDQFAVGITLWEMLCSRKLFTAKNDLAVLKLIQQCNVPKPSSINPNVPAELDEIVFKALSKDRSQRFENMDKFNRALVKFLYSNYPEFNATDLGYFSKQLFKEEITADKKKFVEYGKIDIKPYLQDIENGNSNGGGEVAQAQPSNAVEEKTEKRTEKREIDFGDLKVEDETLGAVSLDEDKSATIKRKVKRPAPQKIVAKTEPEKSLPKIAKKEEKTLTRSDKTSVRRTREAKPEKKNLKVPALIVAGLAVVAYMQFGTGKKSSSKSATRSVSSSQANVKGSGVITFKNYSADMKIYINGKKVRLDGIELELGFNQTYRLEIRRPGYKKYTFPSDIEVTPENPIMTVSIPRLEEEKTGFLTTSMNYSSGSKIQFEVDGEVVEKSLPLKNERLPAGEYEAKISNPLLGTERKIIFTIEQDKRNFLK